MRSFLLTLYLHVNQVVDLANSGDEIAKDVASPGPFIRPADLGAQEAIEAAGHERQL